MNSLLFELSYSLIHFTSYCMARESFILTPQFIGRLSCIVRLLAEYKSQNTRKPNYKYKKYAADVLHILSFLCSQLQVFFFYRELPSMPRNVTKAYMMSITHNFSQPLYLLLFKTPTPHVLDLIIYCLNLHTFTRSLSNQELPYVLLSHKCSAECASQLPSYVPNKTEDRIQMLNVKLIGNKGKKIWLFRVWPLSDNLERNFMQWLLSYTEHINKHPDLWSMIP